MKPICTHPLLSEFMYIVYYCMMLLDVCLGILWDKTMYHKLKYINILNDYKQNYPFCILKLWLKILTLLLEPTNKNSIKVPKVLS